MKSLSLFLALVEMRSDAFVQFNGSTPLLIVDGNSNDSYENTRNLTNYICYDTMIVAYLNIVTLNFLNVMLTELSKTTKNT